MKLDKKNYQMHAGMCKVFTNPKQLEILNLLRDGEKTVTQIEEATGVHQSNVSQHLGVLKEKMIFQTRNDK